MAEIVGKTQKVALSEDEVKYIVTALSEYRYSCRSEIQGEVAQLYSFFVNLA